MKAWEIRYSGYVACRAADAINEHLGTNNVTTMQLDVAQFDNVRKFVDEFLSKHEPLHILINNAGSLFSLILGLSACKMTSLDC